MVLPYIAAGLSVAGGIASARARRRAEEAARQQALQNRALIQEATEQTATQIQAGAQPLLAQAVGLERASRFRDPMVEQGLVAGLRQQAGAQAAQSRQLGQGDRRGAVVGQLLRGQGLLAAESQRLQRFTQLSQMAAGLRSQSAQIMGQAAQARMQGAVTMAGINVPQSSYSPLGVGLTALGQGLSAIQETPSEDTPEDLTEIVDSSGPVPDVIAPEALPLPQATTSDIGDFATRDSFDFEDTFEPLAPMGMGSRRYVGEYDAPVGFGKPPPGLRNIRFDESRAPMGGQGITARPQEEQYDPGDRRQGDEFYGFMSPSHLRGGWGPELGLGPDTRRGDGSGMFNRNEWELEKLMQPRAGQPQRPYSEKSWYKDWSNAWWR